MQGQGPHFPPTRKATIHIHRGEGGKGVKMGTLHWGGCGGGACQTWIIYMGVEPKIGGKPSQIIHFNRVLQFYIINHPFWGTPIFGNTHMYTLYVAFSPNCYLSNSKTSPQSMSSSRPAKDAWHQDNKYQELWQWFGQATLY